MLATRALAEARGTSPIVVTSAPIRRLALSVSLSPLQFHAVMRQAREPCSVQQEKIRRPWATEKSNSVLLTSTGPRPSSDMNHSGWPDTNSFSSRPASVITTGFIVFAGFVRDIGRYAKIATFDKL
jgi:hypothetical protein